ncbi:MAG: hypothetical protein JST32_13065, partial [Bacteroidetes bacterium]|nr:hypothetical protein [Bacteroidota bacterium]
LCLTLLPSNSRVAHPTSKLRWRSFTQDNAGSITNDEYGDFAIFIISELTALCGNNPARIATLFDHVQDLTKEALQGLIAHVENNLAEIDDAQETLRSSIRNLLHSQHSNHRANWQVGADEYNKINSLYDHLSPKDISSLLYVFDDHWPHFPEGFGKKGEDPNAQERYIWRKRLEIIRKLYRTYTFDDFLALVHKIKEPGILGNSSAFLPLKQAEQLRFAALCASENRKEVIAGINYISRLYFKNGLPFMIRLYRKLVSVDSNDNVQLGFLIALRSEFAVWQFVETLSEEIQHRYWRQCEANFWDKDAMHQEYAIRNLSDAGRYYSALKIVSFNLENQPTELMSKLLIAFANSPGSDIERPDTGHISHVIDELSKRTDTDDAMQARIEWYYLDLLTRRYQVGEPLKLYNELARNPSFFVDIVCFWFMPDNDVQIQKEQEGLDPEFISQRARKAYKLLDEWDVVPGSYYNESGEICLEGEQLNQWIADARRMVAERGRPGKADTFIGRVLAKYPEVTNAWPPTAIATLIESPDSVELRSSFRAAIVNKRSWSSRGIFTGGERERDLASYFQRLAAWNRSQFPITADLLSAIAESYLHRAKEEDNDALANDLDY